MITFLGRAIALGSLLLLPVVQDASAKTRLKYMMCLPHDTVIGNLVTQYNERLIGLGINPAGELIEMWSSPGYDGTFTVLIVDPDGDACVLSTGNNWEIYNPIKGNHF